MGDSYVLAADVGGTNLRTAAVDPDGTVLHQVSTATPHAGTSADIVAAILAGAAACITSMSGKGQPSGFGLALAALVNTSEGRVLSAPNLHELDGLPLAEIISADLNLPVFLENDATGAAIGEHWLGSSKDVADSIFVTLGTGIGGGLILGGEPYRGIDGTAGEIGHIFVEPDGIDCGCGSRGCVEQYASATAIARIARELAELDPKSVLHGRGELTAKGVYEAAVENDAVAIESFRVMSRYLGIALAGLVNVLNPEMIVIGGGVAAGWIFFEEPLQTEIRSRAFKAPADRVRMVRASLGNLAGILGAARVAFDSIRP